MTFNDFLKTLRYGTPIEIIGTAKIDYNEKYFSDVVVQSNKDSLALRYGSCNISGISLTKDHKICIEIAVDGEVLN